MKLKNLKYLVIWALVLSILSLVVPAATVDAATPTIGPISPSSGMQDTTIKQVVVQGTNFVDPTSVTFSGAGVAAVVGSVLVVAPTLLTVDINILPSAAAGARDVTVSNANGSATKTGGFTINAAVAPTIGTLSPNHGIAGAVYKGIVITGTNFLNSTTLSISTSGITVSNLIRVSDTQLTITISIAAGVAVGLKDVVVTTIAGSTTKTGGFEVTGPQIPIINAITPAFGNNTGVAQPMVITGANFTATSTVIFSGSGVTANNTIVADATSISLSYTIDAAAAAGPRDIKVVNSSGTSNAMVFTVYRATLSVNSPGGVSAGSTFSVYINVSSVAKLDSSQFDLKYDPAVIKPVGVEGGIGVSNGLIGGSANVRESWGFIPPGVPGEMGILTNNPGISGVFGSGYLVKIDFQVLGAAGTSSPLTLVTNAVAPQLEINLISGDQPVIPVDSINSGTININGLTISSVTPPATYTGVLSEGMLNKAYPATTATASGGSGVYTWSAPGLPNGLSINSSTGVISGTPTQSGDFIVNLVVLDSSSPPKFSTSGGFLLHVYPALNMTATGLPDATQNALYTGAPAAEVTGGKPPYAWSATGLPTGLTIDAGTGVISGTPSASGDSNNIVVTASDSFSPPNIISSQALALHVNAALNITTASSLPTGSAGSPYTPTTIVATGGKPGYNWSATGLPQALSINATTGVISGTPAIPGSFNSVSITVKDTFTPQNSFTKTFTLLVNGPLQVNTTALDDGVAGAGYSYQLAAGGGTPAYTWSSNTTLPAWLQFSTAGILSSTAAVSGNTTINFTVTDGAQGTASATLTLHVYDRLQISTSSLPEGIAGSSYSTPIMAGGGKAAYRWSAAGLPSGLTIDPNSGLISGIPAGASEGSVAITVSDSATPAQTGNPKTLTLKIYAAFQLASQSPLPDAMAGSAYSTPIAVTGGKPSYSWNASGLPAGWTIDTGTGIISGTVSGNLTVPVTYNNIQITVTDSFSPNHNTVNGTFSLTVYPALAIQTAVLPRSAVETGTNLPAVPGWALNIPYSGNLTATGGKPGYTWSANGLPVGITLSPAGVFGGTPTIAGLSANITLTVTDSASPQKSASQTFALRIYENGDADGDGKVDIADVTYAVRVILGLNEPRAGCDARLPASPPGTGSSGNGIINVGDVAIIEFIIGNSSQ